MNDNYPEKGGTMFLGTLKKPVKRGGTMFCNYMDDDCPEKVEPYCPEKDGTKLCDL